MAVLIPSFFKIRLVIIIIGVLVVFFVLGLVKSVFAYSVGDVITHPWDGRYKQITKAYISTITGCMDITWFPYWEWTKMTYNAESWASPVNCPSPLEQGHSGHITFFDMDCQQEYAAKIDECGGSDRILSWDDNSCTGQCALCVDEKATLLAQCGGSDKYFIDDETCEGHCLPDEDCTDEYNAKIVECGSVQDIIKWSNETCEGLCSNVRQNAGPPDRCEN